MHLNVEIKAVCKDPSFIRDWLLANKARFAGTDHQVDSYFPISNGRLKLREGNIEKALIHYEREGQKGPKSSRVTLYPAAQTGLLKEVLEKALGLKVVVDKTREIYFIDNVKFHIDKVKGLGNFVEIEAIDNEGVQDIERLRKQCECYLRAFKIKEEDLLENSYSDMLLGRK